MSHNLQSNYHKNKDIDSNKIDLSGIGKSELEEWMNFCNLTDEDLASLSECREFEIWDKVEGDNYLLFVGINVPDYDRFVIGEPFACPNGNIDEGLKANFLFNMLFVIMRLCQKIDGEKGTYFREKATEEMKKFLPYDPSFDNRFKNNTAKVS